ncbi:MAG: protein-tyrosine kinase [Sphingomonas bacterium]|nr:Wzz/FepE/Etk N-terminal domain-containing protein [Sphingomonas bacterium]MDB5690304.1 protein-tyrosine kinase [Sphingomonas bacterium]
MMTSDAGLDPAPDGQGRGADMSWRNLLPDPRVMAMVFRRHLWLFVATFALIVAAVATWAYLQVPTYSAKASILVEPQAESVVNIQSVSPNVPVTTDIVDTTVQLMQSRTLGLRVADRFAARHPDRLDAGPAGRAALAQELSGSVNMYRVGSTFVIEVLAQSPSAAEAAEIANLFVTQFVAMDRETKVSANSSADTWLRARTVELARAATAADAALQQYKISHGLMSANGATMAEQEVSSLNQQISAAQAELAEKQGRLSAARAQLQAGGKGADVGAALGSGTIGTLRAREAEASAQVAQLQARYGPLYPDLRKSQNELAEIRSQIQLEIDRILSNLDAEVRVAASRLSSLQSSKSQSTGTLAANNAASVGLTALQRRADAAKAIYETFLNRSRETNAQQGLERADYRVSQLAEPATLPDFPNLTLAALLAIVGGLVGGLTAVGAAEYLQTGISTKADVERRLRVRYAGAVPLLASTLGGKRTGEAPHEYIVSHPFSVYAEAFRALRAFLVLGSGTGPGGSRSVAIVSPLPQEGKTTTAVCIARVAAMAGVPTVLIDCDLRRRGSSELLGVRANGLYDYLSGAATLDQALEKDEATGLFVLGTAQPQPDARDPLTSEALEAMLAELKQRFKVILFDTAPILGVADTRAVAAQVDRVLLINRWRRTSLRASEAAIDILLDVGAKLSGVALTQVDVTRYASTGHNDVYGYQKKFQGYYVN